jgi:hypothetical protein
MAMILSSETFPAAGQSLPPEPRRVAGTSVTGAFEGWFRNPDGTYSLLMGYYNRNLKQELDISIGPNNRIEPGGPDRGQPTHFLPGRAWGIFTIRVPADFGESKLAWTIVANGRTTVIPASLKAQWEISPFKEVSAGNTPPVVSFEENGPSVQGPRPFRVDRGATVGTPLALSVWVSDDAKYVSESGAKSANLPPPVRLRWTKYRGIGRVTFSSGLPQVEERKTPGAGFFGTATTTATFDEPGEYVLQVIANDYSGDGGAGFQCCWTTAQVHVTVQK